MGKAFAFELIFDFLWKLLPFLPITLFILVTAIALGIVIGLVVAIPRLYKIPVLNTIAYLYLSYSRGTPVLVQLFVIYFGLPQILLLFNIDISRADPLIFVILAYGLNWGAIISEIIRGSVSSVDQGQIDAAHSIGMSSGLVFKRVIAPQALVVAAPNFFNLVFTSLKNTSLAFSIGVLEMMFRANSLGSNTNHFLESYIAVAIIYYVVYLILAKIFSLSEKRLSRHKPQLVQA